MSQKLKERHVVIERRIIYHQIFKNITNKLLQMKNFFYKTNEAAVANQGEAMESGDRRLLSVAEVKNAASPKSLMSRVNIYNFIVTLIVAVFLGMGLSACSQVGAQVGENIRKVSKIPDGTYILGNQSLTVSGNKITMNLIILSNYVGGGIGEFTSILLDNDLILYNKDEGNAYYIKYILDGNNLILFPDFYSTGGSSNPSPPKGKVFTKK